MFQEIIRTNVSGKGYIEIQGRRLTTDALRLLMEYTRISLDSRLPDSPRLHFLPVIENRASRWEYLFAAELKKIKDLPEDILHTYAKLGKSEHLEVLLDRGLKSNKDKNGKTPLDIILERNDIRGFEKTILKLLNPENIGYPLLSEWLTDRNFRNSRRFQLAFIPICDRIPEKYLKIMLKTGLSINLGGKKIYTLARVYAELGEFSRLAAILVNCDLKMLRNEFLKIKKSARRYGGSELQSRIDKYWNLIK